MSVFLSYLNAGHLEQRLFSAQSLRIHQFRETVGDIVRNFLLQPGHGDLGMVIYMPLLDHAQSSFFDWRSTIRLARGFLSSRGSKSWLQKSHWSP